MRLLPTSLQTVAATQLPEPHPTQLAPADAPPIDRLLPLLQGQRASLPSASIMIRQPMQRFAQMQASDIDIYRNEIRKTKNELVGACSPVPAADRCLQEAPSWAWMHCRPTIAMALLLHRAPALLQVRLLSRHTGHTIEEVDKEINRPRYFEPYEAVEWGIIDKVGKNMRQPLLALLHQSLHPEGTNDSCRSWNQRRATWHCEPPHGCHDEGLLPLSNSIIAMHEHLMVRRVVTKSGLGQLSPNKPTLAPADRDPIQITQI